MNTEKKSSKLSWFYLVLVLFLGVIIGLSLWLISLKSNISTLEQEKEVQRLEFQREVDSLMLVHDQMKASYGELSQELIAKDSVIQANAEEIKKLLDSQWDYNRVKRKLAQLQKVSQKYIQQLDSVYTVNRELMAENERMREQVNEEKRQNSTLNKQKEELTKKVNQASVLRIYNLDAEAVRLKNGKQVVTDRANRAERIKVSFTIARNDLVKSGTKTFYLRIADPDKAIICKGTSDEYAFKYKNDLLQFTEKVLVNFDGNDTDVVSYYIKPAGKDLSAGYYFIDIYDNNDNLIGQTSLDLK